MVTVCDVANLFSAFFLLNKKQVDFVELTVGQLSDKHRYWVYFEQLGESEYVKDLCLELGALSGNQKLTKHRYLSSESQILNPLTDERIDFLHVFFDLDTEIKSKLIKGIDCAEDVEFKNVLLLNSAGYTEWNTKLKYPYYYFIYLYLADYYMNGRGVIFKDHPQTSTNYFNSVLTHYVKSINAQVPIEFFFLNNNFRINMLLSVSSTSNDKIKSFVNNQVQIGADYFVEYEFAHRLYVAFELLNLVDNNCAIHRYGIQPGFLVNYKKYVMGDSGNFKVYGIDTKILKGNIFTIFGHIPQSEFDNIKSALRNADDNTMACFLSDNIFKGLGPCDQDIYNCFVPFLVQKIKLREETFGNTNDEMIYFYCKDQKIRKIAKDFCCVKKLNYCGYYIKSMAVYLKEDNIDEKNSLFCSN